MQSLVGYRGSVGGIGIRDKNMWGYPKARGEPWTSPRELGRGMALQEVCFENFHGLSLG